MPRIGQGMNGIPQHWYLLRQDNKNLVVFSFVCIHLLTIPLFIMIIYKLLLAVSVAAVTSTTTLLAGNKPNIVDSVNPLIGASTSTEAGKSLHGLGKTFPGPTTPFRLIQKTSTAFSPHSSPSTQQ